MQSKQRFLLAAKWAQTQKHVGQYQHRWDADESMECLAKNVIVLSPPGRKQFGTREKRSQESRGKGCPVTWDSARIALSLVNLVLAWFSCYPVEWPGKLLPSLGFNGAASVTQMWYFWTNLCIDLESVFIFFRLLFYFIFIIFIIESVFRVK